MLRSKILMIYLFLTAATLLAFWQVNHCAFINYDDDLYVTQNIHIQNGLTMGGIRWAFATGHAGNWHPLTWISHMIDVQAFGLNPRMHHLTNLLFHLANTLLLFFVLRRMTKAVWQSAFVAALFALHPLHVESVAWMAERKDVLSTFFWMLTMAAYSSYVARRSLRRYLPVFAFFALGLMAKPMLVTLPFILLLCDYWPLERFERKSLTKSVKPRFIVPLLWEKLPFFAMAMLSGVITYIVQQKAGAVAPIKMFPLGLRLENAVVSYVVYIGKMLWPKNLAVFYPYAGQWHLWQVSGAVLILLAVTLPVILTAKKLPYLTVGWLWYLGTLVPAIGLVQVGSQAMADRYTYVPLIGLFIMAAWGIPELLRKWRYRKTVFFASSTVTLACFSLVTWAQVGYWQNNFTLFGHALNATQHNYVAYKALGIAWADLGMHKWAIQDYDRAIEIDQEYGSAYNNRGNAYAALGMQERALRDYDRAIAISPKLAEPYNNRGYAYAALGMHKRAIQDYDRAIAISPKLPLVYINRGNAYAALGMREQAMQDYDSALEIEPKLPLVYINRGNAYASFGMQERAIQDYDRAIAISPKLAVAYRNRAISYDRLGNKNRAYQDLLTAAISGDTPAQNFLRSHGIAW